MDDGQRLPHATGLSGRVQVGRSLPKFAQVPDFERFPTSFIRRITMPVIAPFSPVCVETPAGFVYGQLLASTARNYTVRVNGAEAQYTRRSVFEVAPAVCFGLASPNGRFAGDDRDVVEGHHHLLLDRLLGQNNRRATRSMRGLLRGIIPVASYPDPSETITWRCPTSAIDLQVSRQHVVDFGFYVDGGRPIPPNMRVNVGLLFYKDPTNQPAADGTGVVGDGGSPRNRAGRTSGPLRELEQLLASDSDKDDEENDDEPIPDALPPSAKRPRVHPTAAPASRLKIMEALADTPELLRYYVAQCQTADASVNQSPSAIVPAAGTRERAVSKFSFRPTESQQTIHNSMASVPYKGKTPTEYVDAVISSSAVRFQPHPALIARLYAFEFGVRGLSTLHFFRFDLTARLKWQKERKVNMHNFAASVDLPPPAHLPTMDSFADALVVISLYAREFLDLHAQAFVNAARDFEAELRGLGPWSSTDVETLAFWFDSVFDVYRRSVCDDDASATDVRRRAAPDCFTMRDPELQGLLYKLQTERLMTLTSRTSAGPVLARPQYPVANATAARTGRVPPEVLAALPKHGGKSVCLKYLSQSGCSSRSRDQCVVPHRVHHIPQQLPAVVRQYVEDRLGGLRSDF